jgi:hypothetical protein
MEQTHTETHSQNKYVNLESTLMLARISHMVMDYLGGIGPLSVNVELTKVIDQWSHTGRKVNHPVH